MASAELLDWCRHGGVQAEGIEASYVEEGGRGLVAVVDLPPGAPPVHWWQDGRACLLPACRLCLPICCCASTQSACACMGSRLQLAPPLRLYPAAAGTCILRVPRRLLMSVESAKRDAQLAAALQQAGQGLSSEQVSGSGCGGALPCMLAVRPRIARRLKHQPPHSQQASLAMPMRCRSLQPTCCTSAARLLRPSGTLTCAACPAAIPLPCVLARQRPRRCRCQQQS